MPPMHEISSPGPRRAAYPAGGRDTVTASIALLGLGEAGSEIARDLVAAGADVRGYDPKGILVTGVAARISEANAVRDAGLVLSVNSGHDALTALVNALGSLRPGTIWADLNTAAPGVKAALVRQLTGRDVPVADVALLSPVPGKGLRTPMLASGDGAAVRRAARAARCRRRGAARPGRSGDLP